jgi:hypothetical protein
VKQKRQTHHFRRLLVPEELSVSPFADTVSLIHTDVDTTRAEGTGDGGDHLGEKTVSVTSPIEESERTANLVDEVVRLLAVGKKDLGGVSKVSELWPLQHLTAAKKKVSGGTRKSRRKRTNR